MTTFYIVLALLALFLFITHPAFFVGAIVGLILGYFLLARKA